MNVNMNLNMDSTAHNFNPPAASSTAPYATIPSATTTATATATHPSSNPLLFSSTTSTSTSSSASTNPTLNPNPHHAPAADPLHHLQQQQQQPLRQEEHPGMASSAAAPGAAEPALQPSATNYPHQVEGAGGPTATAPFLRDFSLVAEAAKRAQMSVVMRDLESVTL